MSKRSYCPNCHEQIAWYDNLPVLSFALLKGKCRHCEQPISWQYPLIELATGLLFVLAWLKVGGSDCYGLWVMGCVELLRYIFIIAVMLMILVFDARWYLIPDKITLPAIVLVFPLSLMSGFEWQDLAISGIIGGGFFLFQFLVSRGRWIGGGDIRMGVLMGAALGLKGLIIALFLAYILGSVIGLALLGLGKKEWGSQIPFGIFLSTGTLIALFYGTQLADWYLRLLGV